MTKSAFDKFINSSGSQCAPSPHCKKAIGWGTLILIVVGVAGGLFGIFWVPKPPFAIYQSSSVTFHPYTVVQTYKVVNRNIYPLTLSNFDVSVATDTVNGAMSSGEGQLDDADGTMMVPGHSFKNFNLIYVYNLTSAEQASIQKQCKAGGLSYTTVGSVDMDFMMGNFREVRFGPWAHSYTCGSS